MLVSALLWIASSCCRVVDCGHCEIQSLSVFHSLRTHQNPSNVKKNVFLMRQYKKCQFSGKAPFASSRETAVLVSTNKRWKKCLFVSVPQLKPWGSPSVWWDSSVCSCFPTPARTAVSTVRVTCSCTHVHSIFRDFSNGVCHVTKLPTWLPVAERNPSVKLLNTTDT